MVPAFGVPVSDWGVYAPNPAPQAQAAPGRLGRWTTQAAEVGSGARVYTYPAGKQRRTYVRWEWKDNGGKRRTRYIAPLYPVWSKRRMTDGERQKLEGRD
jgi:hypothetical protein